MTTTSRRRGWIACFVLILTGMAPHDGLAQDEEWQALCQLSIAAYDAGQYQESLEYAQRAVPASEAFGLRDVRVAETLRRVGLAYDVLGRFVESERAYVRALSILEEDAGEGFLLAQVLEGLALVQLHSGSYARAERLMQRAVAMGGKARGSDHPDVAGMLANLASAQMMLRKDSEAQALFERALALFEAGASQYQQERAGIMANLGFLAFWRSDISAANAYLERSVTAHEAVVGRHHPQMIRPLLNLARVRLELKHTKDAEGPVFQAMTIAEGSFGGNHLSLYEVCVTYAAVLRETGRKKEARQMEARAKAILATNRADVEHLTVDISGLYSRKRTTGGRSSEK
jgi:tetratricopeptide (TPR) repeat protein